MEVIGAVVVALLGACVGLLLGLFLQGARKNHLAEQASAERATARTLAEQASQQRAAVLGLLEKQHAELRAHLMTMTAALADRMQLVGSALAAALREANAEHRNDLRLAIGLPRASTPGEEPPETRHPAEAKPLPKASHAARPKTGDEPTPPSGWTLEQVRTHTATAEERRS